MKRTRYFNFKKPEPYDTRNIDDINESFDLVDTELKKTQDTNKHLDETFKQLTINAGNDNSEIVAARRDRVANKTYDSVPERLDDVSSQLRHVVDHRLGWINAIEYGFVNDGITDNSTTMERFFLEDSNNVLYFDNGIYCFSRPIISNGPIYFKLDNIAELKCVVECECFLVVNRGPVTTRGAFFTGGIINGSFLCNGLVGLNGIWSMEFKPKVLKNCNTKFIQTKYNGEGANVYTEKTSALLCHGMYIVNEVPILNSVAIYDDADDNIFHSIIIRDVQQGIYTKSSKFDKIHHWLSEVSLIYDSLFAYIAGRNAKFTNCTIDTVRKGFHTAAWQFCNVSVITWMINRVYYTNEMLIAYPPIMFEHESNCVYNVHGVGGTMMNDFYFLSDTNYSDKSEFSNIYIHNEPGTAVFYNMPYSVRDINTQLNTNKRNLTGASNFNITENGLYHVDTYTGMGGVGVPPVQLVGLMEVVIAKNKNFGFQRITGQDKILLRRYSDGNFAGNWYSAALTIMN